MKTFAMRAVMLTAVVGLGFLGDKAEAGNRRMRLFRSNCGAQNCSAPCGLGNSCGSSAPVYVTPPLATCACSGPEYSMSNSSWSNSAPMYGGSMYSQPAWGEAASFGEGPAANFDSAYGTALVNGSTGPAMPFQEGGSLGVQGFAGTQPLPAYYAPMSAQYAPIPPSPVGNIVW